MHTFEYYREHIINAPSELVREQYRAEAFRSGKFTAEQLDRLCRIAGPDRWPGRGVKEGEIMDAMKAIAQKNSLRTERDTWKRTAVCLLAAAVLPNAALWRAAGDIRQLRLEVQQAELDRNAAVRRLNALAEDIDKEQQARAAQAMAYETVSGYQYIGECVITAYCPCAECCGQWADGLTATGIPASGGIVAVDPAVIPLGSTVIIGGLEYLAADTGVDGMHIDICTNSHQEAEAFGKQTAAVWVIPGGTK